MRKLAIIYYNQFRFNINVYNASVKQTALLVFSVFIYILIFAACSDSTTDSIENDATDNITEMTLILDQGRKSEGLFGAEGGEISAESSDGTVFTLTIPEGAVTDTVRNEVTEISITPILTIEDIPVSGGFSFGIDFEPKGLELLKPAILTVNVPDEILVEN